MKKPDGIAIRGSAALLLGTGITSLLSLIYSVYAGRILGPEKYSAFAAALSLFYVLSIAAVPVNNTATHPLG